MRLRIFKRMCPSDRPSVRPKQSQLMDPRGPCSKELEPSKNYVIGGTFFKGTREQRQTSRWNYFKNVY